MKLLTHDNSMEMIQETLTEDEFLKVMLVYYGNYRSIKSEIK